MENHANTETQWWGMSTHSGLDLTGRSRTTTIVLHPVTRSTWQLFVVKPFPLSPLIVKCLTLEKILWPNVWSQHKKAPQRWHNTIRILQFSSSLLAYTVPHGSVCVKSAELPNCVLCHDIKIRNSSRNCEFFLAWIWNQNWWYIQGMK